MHPVELELRNVRAAARAATSKKVPFVFYNEGDIESMPPFPFPDLGDYRPKGWSLLDDPAPLFCDSTGCGSPNEPALTIDQLKQRLRELHEEDPGYGYAIIGVGQFQLYVGVFKKKKEE